MTSERVDVGEGEVHLWHVDPSAIVEPERLGRYASWLTADEEVRRRRFVFDRHRHAFLVARALVRGTLARYTGLEPAALRFEIGPHGRPELDPGQGGGLRFNLSHTDGRAVVAVARGEIGVDVEAEERRGELAKIAEHFFAAPEVASLQGLSGAALRRRFFAYWTLKEAYIKARGVGIGLGLDRFWFAVDEGDAGDGAAPTIAFVADFDDEPTSWCFRRLSLGSGFPAALALRQPSGAPLRVECRAVVPGEDSVGGR